MSMGTGESGVQKLVGAALGRVAARFEGQLSSDLPALSRLTAHVESYRGKMLRPTLVIVCGLAAAPAGAGGAGREVIGDSHITCAAVCEMVHMATLVHDDVLDEAGTRRRGATVNRLHGNETAVILGDYLIASAYHLCSQLSDQSVALKVARVSMTVCAGELLQLSRRDDYSLDEATYLEIIGSKTASLVALACRLGARCSGASEEACGRFERFGSKIGAAFQIQDDVLDLTGRQAALGKPVGQDLAKGKLTLPMIHHLASVAPVDRGRSLVLLERACGGGEDAGDAAGVLVHAMEHSGSLEHARGVAKRLVEEAKGELEGVPDSPARGLLLSMAEQVVERSR
jgi:octaprenyl-diphosphate synthase